MTDLDGYRHLSGERSWAKVSGGKGRWRVALGLTGQTLAEATVHTARTKRRAAEIATEWVSRQEAE